MFGDEGPSKGTVLLIAVVVAVIAIWAMLRLQSSGKQSIQVAKSLQFAKEDLTEQLEQMRTKTSLEYRIPVTDRRTMADWVIMDFFSRKVGNAGRIAKSPGAPFYVNGKPGEALGGIYLDATGVDGSAGGKIVLTGVGSTLWGQPELKIEEILVDFDPPPREVDRRRQQNAERQREIQAMENNDRRMETNAGSPY